MLEQSVPTAVYRDNKDAIAGLPASQRAGVDAAQSTGWSEPGAFCAGL
jgi:hypothetical protein